MGVCLRCYWRGCRSVRKYRSSASDIGVTGSDPCRWYNPIRNYRSVCTNFSSCRVLLVLAAHGDQDELISSRLTQITGVTFLLFFLFTLSIEMSSLSSPYLTGNDAIVFLLAGVWFLIVTRTLKQNNRKKREGALYGLTIHSVLIVIEIDQDCGRHIQRRFHEC